MIHLVLVEVNCKVFHRPKERFRASSVTSFRSSSSTTGLGEENLTATSPVKILFSKNVLNNTRYVANFPSVLFQILSVRRCHGLATRHWPDLATILFVAEQAVREFGVYH